jgi:hypothetical protein
MKLFLMYSWVIPTLLLVIGILLGRANLLMGLTVGAGLIVLAFLMNMFFVPVILDGVPLQGFWVAISQLWSLAGTLIVLPWVVTITALVTSDWRNSVAVKAAAIARKWYEDMTPEEKERVKEAVAKAAAAQMGQTMGRMRR